MEKILFTPKTLVIRWSLPLATLSQWRWLGKGPVFLKMGPLVFYQVRDIENFEQENVQQATFTVYELER